MSDWSELLGEHVLDSIRMDVRHPFDADASGVAFELDDMTVFVFEDPDDGYRSHAAAPIIVKQPMYAFGCSPDYIRIPVIVSAWEINESGGEADGIEIRDRRNGKLIFRVGTDNSDDYYPWFTCEWHPENIAENARIA